MTPKPISWKNAKHHKEIYLFLIPTLVLIALFQYYPAASGVFHSFFRWNGADISEYVGFGNYKDLLSNKAFWQSFKVALLIGVWNIVKMIPALLVAVCIHRCSSTKMQFVYRILFVVPMVIPGLIIVLIWRSFFFESTSGYLNQFLTSTGGLNILAHVFPGVFTPGTQPVWLGDPRLILVACIVWGFPWVGSFAVLTHLAKLQNISKDVYEAADIDGIGWFSKFTRIELPLIMGSVYLLLVFVIIDTIKDAGMVLALAGFQGGPGGVVTVPALFMMRKAFLEQQMGYACAVGIILTIVVLVLQKLSGIVNTWPNLNRRLRIGLRIAVVAIGLFMFKGGMKFGGVALIAFVTPWGILWQITRDFVRRIFSKVNEALPDVKGKDAQATPPPRYVPKPSWLRRTAFGRRLRKLWDYSLRGSRHAFIWLVLAFAFLPLYLMVIVSFKTNIQFYNAPTTITKPFHPENWSYAWKTVTPTVANSIFVSTSATALTLLFAIGAAYFFARLKMPMSGFLWNALLILMMMPAIANLVPLFRLLADMNLLNTLTALILVGTASGQVFAIFVLRNFVADIPQDLFEAADIDGASHWQQLKNVVIPLSGPILGTVGVMQFIHLWNEFVLPLVVMRDHSRLTVMVELLRMAGEYVKLWGPLMAGYALASIPIIVLFVFSMKLFVKGLTEGAVKG